MSQRFFEVSGRLRTESGKPPHHVLLSLLDSDTYSDDLIGVGAPGPDGRFRVTFTREAFNQDWLENEDIPDIYLVVSRMDENGGLKPFFEKAYPTLSFVGGKEDLGDVVLTADFPVSSSKGSSLFDLGRVRRVDVDDEVIAHVLSSVSSDIEKYTGWRDVAHGVPIKQTYQILNVVTEITSTAIGASKCLPWWTELYQRVQQSMVGGLAAHYDPFNKEIWIDRNVLGQAGLDIMKASVAHELVHVGQFRSYPELVQKYRTSLSTHDARLRYCTRREPDEPMPASLVLDLIEAFAFMCNLEGYARYLEGHFFAKAHTSQRYIPQLRLDLLVGAVPAMAMASMSSQRVHRAVIPQDGTDEQKAAAWLASLDPVAYKAEQYGCDRWYLNRQKGQEPVAFDPDLGRKLLPKLIAFIAGVWDSSKPAI